MAAVQEVGEDGSNARYTPRANGDANRSNSVLSERVENKIEPRRRYRDFDTALEHSRGMLAKEPIASSCL